MTFKKTLAVLLVLISFMLCSSGTLAVYTKQLSCKNVLQMPYHIKTDKTMALDTPALAPAVPSPAPTTETKAPVITLAWNGEQQQPSVTNTGTIPVAVRIRVTERWQFTDGTPEAYDLGAVRFFLNAAGDNTNFLPLSSLWNDGASDAFVKGQDSWQYENEPDVPRIGWFYAIKILAPGESTPVLFDRIQAEPSMVETLGKNPSLSLDLDAEALPLSDPERIKTLWGEDLPDSLRALITDSEAPITPAQNIEQP